MIMVNKINKFFILNAHLISICFFLLIDSTPIYILKDYSIKLQISIIIIYCWICKNPYCLRPFFILLLGLVIDLLKNYFFGFTSLFMTLILFIQQRDQTVLSNPNFSISWIRFFIFISLTNLFLAILHKFNNPEIEINSLELLFTTLMSMLIFPIIYWLVFNLDEKRKNYVE